MGRRLTAVVGLATVTISCVLAAGVEARPVHHAALQPQTLMRYRTTRAMEILGFVCRDLRQGQVTISRYETETIDGILRSAAHVPGHGLKRLRAELNEAIALNRQAQEKIAAKDADGALDIERIAISKVGHVLDVLRREK
ncbi:MAG: hypothetical protein F2663_04275 [Actinobacteria bacterium]|uniref:Unannotated protein n=1 Tax=freshwater metagenome TaxID=449393 RepID=A0A6J6P1U0_9ZZZZ|nr:hypothetical protein [Actinomycetota bacterium]